MPRPPPCVSFPFLRSLVDSFARVSCSWTLALKPFILGCMCCGLDRDDESSGLSDQLHTESKVDRALKIFN